MGPEYRIRLAVPDDAIPMIRAAHDAFDASGNRVDRAIFPEHLRTETSAQDTFDFRVRSLYPTLDRAKYADRWAFVAVCDGPNGEEIAGWSQWVVPAIVDGQIDESNLKTQSAEERIKAAESREYSLDRHLAEHHKLDQEEFG